MSKQEQWRKVASESTPGMWAIVADGRRFAVAVMDEEADADRIISNHEKAHKYDEFLEWITDQQVVHWTLSEENADDPIKGVTALLKQQLDESYDPKVSTIAAKAKLADEVGIAGAQHVKAWWQAWFARYDALSQPVEEG